MDVEQVGQCKKDEEEELVHHPAKLDMEEAKADQQQSQPKLDHVQPISRRIIMAEGNLSTEMSSLPTSRLLMAEGSLSTAMSSLPTSRLVMAEGSQGMILQLRTLKEIAEADQ